MSRFKFKLQHILEYRNLKELQCRMSLLQKRHVLASRELRLKTMKQEYRKALEEKSHHHQNLTAHYLRSFNHHLSYLQQCIREQAETVEKTREEVQKLAEAEKTAKMELQKLENLREKHFRKWKDEQRKIEVAKMDEFNMHRLPGNNGR